MKNFFNSLLSKCRDERSEFYGIKERRGDLINTKK